MFQHFFQRFRYVDVIYAPALVVGAGVAAVGPPGVVAGLLVEHPEAVYEAGVQEVLEALALLVGEAGLALVGLGVGEVDLLVGNIQVAADRDGLLLLQGLQVVEEGLVPLLVAEREPAQESARGRRPQGRQGRGRGWRRRRHR